MSYRNIAVEDCVLKFYKTLPKNIVQFPFNIKRALSTLNNCKFHSYQEYAERHGISVKEVIDYCESESSCTHQIGNYYIILFNDDDSIVDGHKIFSLGHELAHIIREHKLRSSITEREADYFSATVFCPIPILSKIKPKSTLSIQKVFGLSGAASEIAFEDFKNYDKNFNIKWHDKILKLFDFQCGLLKYYTEKCDEIYFSIQERKIAPMVNIPTEDDFPAGIRISIPRIDYEARHKIIKPVETAEIEFNPDLFNRAELDWLYPKSLGLS